MARVSVIYDNDIKEQVFMVRGDERYARSTKTILELGSYVEEGDYFNQTVTVNVLRDVGDATILIYDNDSVIATIDDWSSTDNARTIVLEELAFEVEHNLYAEYTGNSKCQRSKSKTLQVLVHDSNRYDSILSITGSSHVNPHAEKTYQIELGNSENIIRYDINQPIYVYYDDNAPITVTTSEELNHEGEATVTIPDMGNAGLHTIKVVFGGSTNVLGKTVTKQVSVGYKIETVSYPNMLINGASGVFKAKVTDFFGNPVSDQLVRLSSSRNSNVLADSNKIDTMGSTNNNGIVTISANQLYDTEASGYSIYALFRTSIVGAEYVTDSFKFSWIVPSSAPEISISPSALYKGNESTVTVKTGVPVANAPVILSNMVSDTIYTNEKGIATKQVTSDGMGKYKTIHAVFGGKTSTKAVTNYAQYWDIKEGILKPSNEHYVGNGALIYLVNRFSLTRNTGAVVLLLPVSNTSFELHLESVISTMPCKLGIIGVTNSGETNIELLSYANVPYDNEHFVIKGDEGVVTFNTVTSLGMRTDKTLPTPTQVVGEERYYNKVGIIATDGGVSLPAQYTTHGLITGYINNDLAITFNKLWLQQW